MSKMSGFVKGKSVITAAIIFIENLIKEIDTVNYDIGLLLLHLSRVYISILVKTLHALQMKGIGNLIKSDVTNRLKYVSV